MKIILPDFLSYSLQGSVPPLQAQDFPVLVRLLRGQCSNLSTGYFWQHIGGADDDWPGMAPITLAYDMPAAPTGFWLRADPVLLRPSIDNLLMFPGERLALETIEATALVRSLNQLFADDGMVFYAPTPNRWYVHCQKVPQVTFTDLETVIGRQVDGFLPAGDDALRWHRYLNEIQMVFYTHPVNEARASAHRQLVSSVWFWGPGHFPLAKKRLAKNACIYSERETTRWQAQALGYTSEKISAASLTDCHDNAIWVVHQLSDAVMHGDRFAWQSALQMIEQTYLKVAYQALSTKKIAHIELIFPGEKVAYQVITRRTDCWKFWRTSPAFWSEVG